MSTDQLMRVLYLGLLATALLGWVLVEYRGRMGQALRMSLAWGMIFLGLAAGYGLWGQVKGDLMPAQQVTGAGSIRLPRAEDGHYYADVTINGTNLRVLVDTGASGITLSGADAARVGIDPASLVYLGQATTANGIVRTASVRLDSLDLGPFHDSDVHATVNDAPMEGSLLGMDYLGRFRITMADGAMVLSR